MHPRQFNNSTPDTKWKLLLICTLLNKNVPRHERLNCGIQSTIKEQGQRGVIKRNTAQLLKLDTSTSINMNTFQKQHRIYQAGFIMDTLCSTAPFTYISRNRQNPLYLLGLHTNVVKYEHTEKVEGYAPKTQMGGRRKECRR